VSIPFAFTGLDTNDVADLTNVTSGDVNLILQALPGGFAAMFGIGPPNFTYGSFVAESIDLSAEGACTVAFGVYGSATSQFYELARFSLAAGGSAGFRLNISLPYGPTVRPAVKMVEDSGAATALSGVLHVSTLVKTPTDEFPLDNANAQFGLLPLLS
jgi:hypothetical protein